MTIPFLYYFQELRFRFQYLVLSFFITFLCCCIEIHPILYSITRPLKGLHLIITDLFEFWLAAFFLLLYATFFFTIPFLLYTLWAFLVPGLYTKEKERLNFFIFFFSFFYLFSYLIAFYLFIPLGVHFFFLSHAKYTLLPIQCLPKLLPYTSFIIKTFFFSFCLFQISCCILLLIMFNLLTSIELIQLRKFVYFVIIFISALISPPDIISQLIISCSFFFFYELALLFSLWIHFYQKIPSTTTF